MLCGRPTTLCCLLVPASSSLRGLTQKHPLNTIPSPIPQLCERPALLIVPNQPSRAINTVSAHHLAMLHYKLSLQPKPTCLHDRHGVFRKCDLPSGSNWQFEITPNYVITSSHPALRRSLAAGPFPHYGQLNGDLRAWDLSGGLERFRGAVCGGGKWAYRGILAWANVTPFKF